MGLKLLNCRSSVRGLKNSESCVELTYIHQNDLQPACLSTYKSIKVAKIRTFGRYTRQLFYLSDL